MVEKNPHFKFSISSQKSGPVSDFHNSLRITAQECQQGLKYSGSHMAPASSVHGFGIKDDKTPTLKAHRSRRGRIAALRGKP